jgi:hypothetical protein
LIVRGASWRGVILALGLWAAPAAAEKRSVAVLPYLALGISEEEAQRITRIVAREYGSRSGEKTFTADQLKDKLPGDIPDGCPTNRECVSGLASALGVSHVLFASYLVGESDRIEANLAYTGGEENRSVKFSLPSDEESWKSSIREGITPLMSLAPVLPPPETPLYKKPWFWGAAAGGAAVTTSAVLFLVFRPSLGFVR